MMEKKKVFGLDLLRFLSMFGIVGLHVMNQGGIQNNLNIHSYKYYLVLLLIIFFYTSVDLFGLLSGYLNIKKKNNNNKRIIELLCIMVFYCFTIPSVFYLFNLFNIRGLETTELFKNFFPILYGGYWYIICYTFLFFMIPYLNKFLYKLEKKEYKKLLILIFVLLSIIPNIFGLVDFFRINNGYSPFWLIYLYMVGGYIKIYLNDYKDNKRSIKIIFLCLMLSFVLNSLVKNTSYLVLGYIIKGDWFINYISPFIIIFSINLILIFKNIKIKNSKLLSKFIGYLSAASFSIYIIHSNKVIYDYVLGNRFVFLGNFNGFIIITGVLLVILSIYLICMFIDIFRKLIFKLFKIDNLIDFAGSCLDKHLN